MMFLQHTRYYGIYKNMTKWPAKNNYLEIYRAAYNNAADLLTEAKLLFEHKHFARSYALAFTAFEEISKSQFAADVFTGLCKDEDFNKFYRNHRSKMKWMAWVYLDANSYPYDLKWIGPDIDDLEEINPKEPSFEKRTNALYVGIDFQKQKIINPAEKISETDAKEMIHIVEIALYRIWEISGEFGGNQIGIKGFMK